MLWHIGNTTVRTPYRLRDALRALFESPLNGNINGRDQENAFAFLLHEKGVLDAPRIAEGSDVSDLGRKWRVALSQLGFITPQLTPLNRRTGPIDPELALMSEGIEGLSGRTYEITPNGHRLLQSETLSAQQECFLRSLAAYRLPSRLEKNLKVKSFSPLRFVLHVMYALTEAAQEGSLSFQEYALFVQTSSPEDGAAIVAKNIIEFRQSRKKEAGNIRRFDRAFYAKVSAAVERKQATLDDYTDLSFRYLKATGLFHNSGRGITLLPSRMQLASLLRDEEDAELSDRDYLRTLWLGAALPTDNAASSFAIVNDLISQLGTRGIQIPAPRPDTPLEVLESQRHELEALILQVTEQEYADKQAEQLDEILAWLQAIPSRGTARLPDNTTVSIPKGEGPVYLEWAIWRAFLAINHLHSPPWEARRFQIDQDFLPVHCAPGNGPDMIFEFQDAIIVVEVTLTASSRQEAAEGEPVRRHVAQYAERAQKPVYGLFIAVNIDSNTAHTFRSGDWFLKDDRKINLSIVPMTLDDFKNFLASGKDRLAEMPNLLRQLLIECRSHANQEAPLWKQTISQTTLRIAAGGGG